MADTTIKINPQHSSELEFDVKIEGIGESDKPEVRFVVVSKSESCNYSVVCSKVKGKADKWMARLPAFKHISESSSKFFVEVIVDGYYFKPAEGTVQFVKTSKVDFGDAEKKRPKVSTSFSVKQAIDESPDVTGMYAPTNDLLVPEFEPTQSDIKTGEQGNVVKRDKQVDTTRLSDIGDVTVPGLSDHEPQPGADRPPEEPVDDTPLSDVNVSDEDFEEVMVYAARVADQNEDDGVEGDVDPQEDPNAIVAPFDPRKVAESILKSTMGSHAKPAMKGSLFMRDAEGRPVIKGLNSDSPAQRALKEEKAARVRDILNQ